MKSFSAAIIFCTVFNGPNGVVDGTSVRTRRSSLLREQNDHLIPKKFTSFSPIRDNVITMVAMSLDSAGQKKSEIRTSLESVFEHGCHCAWNFGRHELSDKTLKPQNDLDGVCLEFEQCSECVKMDGCDLDADFMPKLNGTKFECDHLIGSPCQYNTCLCSTNMAEKLVKKIDKFEFEKLSFGDFMTKCTSEVDFQINTQMIDIFSSQRGLVTKKERQCCGQFPNRKPFTHSGSTGLACCNENILFNQRIDHCCPNSGEVIKHGDICW